MNTIVADMTLVGQDGERSFAYKRCVFVEGATHGHSGVRIDTVMDDFLAQ